VNRQRGIALIQVLLVVGIIGLLMLQMGLTAREQVARAEALDERAELMLRAQSEESAILFSMLTQKLLEKPESENPYAAVWNFAGRPFEVDGVSFMLQDESGRMQVPQFGSSEFEGLLQRLGVEAGRARRLGEQLLKLQGGRTRSILPVQASGEGAATEGAAYPVQVLDELRLLPDMDDALYSRLEPLLTLYPTPGLNLVTAAPEVLAGRVSGSQLEGVLQARQTEQLDQLVFWKLTGQDADEMTVYYPGPAVTVNMELKSKEGTVRRQTTFIVRPYLPDPLAEWQRSTVSGGASG